MEKKEECGMREDKQFADAFKSFVENSYLFFTTQINCN
jgi:hypothetical protein